MPPLSKHLQLYCERVNDSLFGEPVNALSNIGFFIAAYFLWRCYQRHKPFIGKAPEAVILIALTVIVGAGSTLFHTVATMWSALFDIIPIAFFIFFYLYVFARTILGLRAAGAWGLFAVLAIVNITYKYYVFRAVDGYVSYIPTFLFLAALALYLLILRHVSALPVLCATCIALVSLYCRTIDKDICAAFPIGTHFLWHGLNAVVIYILVRETIIHRTRAP